MDPERWRNIESLYDLIVDFDEDRRKEILKQAGELEEGIRQEVERLLLCREAAGDFLERPALEVALKNLAREQPECQVAENAQLNKMVSHYKFLTILGKGGMAVVYKAEDMKRGRYVALKVLHKDANGGSTRERFVREAKAAYALRHPNICRVYAIERDHNFNPFIAMEFLEGETLKQRMVRRALELGEILLIVRQIAQGLDAAHSAGVIHRDIKPSNIFLTSENEIKILDFGLAKFTGDFGACSESAVASDAAFPGDDITLTGSGTVVGTVAYMSPEQALGEELDLRTDLFSLGVVMYEMSTGQLPFSGKTYPALFNKLLNREPIPPAALNKKVPRELELIIRKALRKKADSRYRSAKEMIADIDELKRKLQSQRSLVSGCKKFKSRW
jgi:serine/threonine protein kinase